MKKTLLLLAVLCTFWATPVSAQYDSKMAMVVHFNDGTPAQSFFVDELSDYYYTMANGDTLMVIRPASAAMAPTVLNANAISTITFDYQPYAVVPWLQSLEFIPQTIYGDMGAVMVSGIKANWYTNLKALTSYIDDSALRQEVIGTKRPLSAENAITDYRTEGNLTDHERYTLSSSTLSIVKNATADYHVNPSDALFDDETAIHIISNDVPNTRTSDAGVGLLGPASGESRAWRVRDGILSVPLWINDISRLGTLDQNGNGTLTLFATQVESSNGSTVTSNYATLVANTSSDLRLAHTRYHRTGNNNTDFIQTGMLNRHCGDCSLPAHDGNAAYTHKGMHLFATIGEAKEYVTTTARVDNPTYYGEGMDLVDYNADIDLTQLVEVHYNNSNGQHGVFDKEDVEKLFSISFELTSYSFSEYGADESAYATIYLNSDGHFMLHPQNPYSGIYEPQPASEVVANHVPMVRVSLTENESNKVVDYGYLPIRIKREEVPVIERKNIIVNFPAGQNISLNIYNGTMMGGEGSANLFTSDWRIIEEYILANSMLPSPLSLDEFQYVYRPETDMGYYSSLTQYYIVNEADYLANPDTEPQFQPTWSSSVTRSMIGTITYTADSWGYFNFYWDATAQELMAVANSGMKQIVRAVRMSSNNPLNYPDMYIVFRTGNITVNNVTVTGNAQLTKHIIQQYWYSTGSNQNGKDEIHVNAISPEENTNDKMDLTRNGWKPTEMKGKFSDVFLNNLSEGNTPTDWLTFETSNGSSVPSMFSTAQVEADFVFADSNNGQKYKGYLWAGGAHNFTVTNIANGDTSRKNLYAFIGTIPNRTEMIATITGNTLDEMAIKLNYESEYAKALLNYTASDNLSADGAFKATVAIEYKWADEQMQQQPLTVTNNTFDVRFLRPISIGRNIGVVSKIGLEPVSIPLSYLSPEYVDYRNVWKNSPINYEQYYAPENMSTIPCYIEGIEPGIFISENHSVLTDIMSETGTRVPLYLLDQDVLFIALSEDGSALECSVSPDASLPPSFHVYIPITVNYFWGRLDDYVEITFQTSEEVQQGQFIVFDRYKDDRAWEVPRNYDGTGPDYIQFTTSWRQTEEDIFSHPAFSTPLDRNTFMSTYQLQESEEGLGHAQQYTVNIIERDGQKYYSFEVCYPYGNYKNRSAGDITFGGNTPYELARFTWNVPYGDILSVAYGGGSNTITRAVKLVSNAPATYPDMFVIFESGPISIY